MRKPGGSPGIPGAAKHQAANTWYQGYLDPNPTRTCLFGLFLGSALGLSLGNSPVTLATGNVFYYLILQCWQDSHDLHPHPLAGLAWFPGAPPPSLGPQPSP